MGLLFHLCLFIAAISTSAAGPVDKSSKRLGHSIEVRVNPDISDEPSSSDNAFMNPDPTFSVDSDGFSDSLLPTDPNTNPSQSLPTEPYLNGASLSVPEESYYSDGSDQVPNLASVGGILLADANQDLSLREDFQCNSNTAICCKGANNGKTKSCDYCKHIFHLQPA